MTSIFFDDTDHMDELRAEARLERQRRRSETQCQCGDDLPGTCPGPANCPHSGHNDGDDE